MEDKIKEYLKLQEKLGILPPLRDNPRNILAHDIAEIVEKDYEEKLIAVDHNIHRMPHKFKHFELFLQEITDLKDEIKHWKKSWDILTKENYKLKQQIDRLHKNEIIYHKRLADIKKLNRDEVQKIIIKLVYEVSTYVFNTTCINFEKQNKLEQEVITAICNLAIPKSTADKIMDNAIEDRIKEFKDKIIEILNRFFSSKQAEQIANEILNDKDN